MVYFALHILDHLTKTNSNITSIWHLKDIEYASIAIFSGSHTNKYAKFYFDLLSK